ncbi:exocyst complex component 3-like [Clytia hemisphaerica]|uniref:Exocyst complex component Sec6 n=2 Tax=Clytia hemisphaerica TaxID=252671 RepID=A0A7M5UVL3_9CNID
MAEDIGSAKDLAFAKAAKYIASCLTTPDQLDKAEQIRRKVLRNKAAVDSRLKTAVQSQIDGIRSGLQELKNVQDDILNIKKLIGETSEIFNEVEPLNVKLKKLEIAHGRHAKLAKTNAHLSLIFNVPDTIKTTQELITNGKFLQAHKNIMELESTRDDLLFEVYKIKEETESEESITESPIYTYFTGVQNLSDALCKQLLNIIQRTISAAKHQPTELVTSLRIVEREERLDHRAMEQEKKSKYMPPGRPKSWKIRCMAVIKKSIDERFDSNQIELSEQMKSENKVWLARHLERMRKMMLDDLLNVKHLVWKCFPPSYEIFKNYIIMYHEAASRTLEDFALNQRSDRPNECVQLLNWINEYDGPDLLGHEKLKEYVAEFSDKLEPLLSVGVINSLMEKYVSTTRNNLLSYMAKMCERDSQDWYQAKLPESDSETYFQTSLPVILFQMIDQNLQVGGFLESDVKLKILDVCIKCLTDFVQTYKEAVEGYRTKYYENRESVPFYDAYMVAICNNCLLIAEFSDRMKSELRQELGEETFGEDRVEGFKTLIGGFQRLSQEICNILLDGLVLDLKEFFGDLLTRKWLTSNSIINTIVCTVQDYANDYTHLKPSAFQYTMQQTEDRIIIEYVRSTLSRRITCRSTEERREAANQIVREAEQVAQLFNTLANLPEFEESVCVVLKAVAEVIRLTNSDIVSLEISGLATKYKDFRSDHALALLAMRGDMGRSEILQLVTDLKIRESDELTDEQRSKSIFGRVAPAGSMFESLESRFKK